MQRFLYFWIFFTISVIAFAQKNHIDLNGLKQGYWKLYFPYSSDSILSEEGLFLNDLEDGLWVKYHDNGQVREIVQYKAGKLDGIRLSLNKKGKLNEQEFFLNGKYHGMQLYFHDTSTPAIFEAL